MIDSRGNAVAPRLGGSAINGLSSNANTEEPIRKLGYLELDRPAGPALVAQLGALALIGLLLILRQGSIIVPLYPAVALAVGIFLYVRYPVHYISYTFWLYFLTPEVRRLSDYYRGAFTETNIIIIAPLAVAMLSGFTLLRAYRQLGQRRAMPLLFLIVAMIYGFIIGAVRASPVPAMFSLSQWLFPLLMAYHVSATWRLYPRYRSIMTKTMVFGGMVMALYGVYEFVVMPPWDKFWLLGSQMSSEGVAEPFGVRVASTMNSSGPYAAMAMACLIFVSASESKYRWVAAVAGTFSLLATAARSSWGGLVLGMLLVMVGLSNAMRLRLAVTLVLVAAVMVPVATMGPWGEHITSRFSTLNNLQSDDSYQVRQGFYAEFFKHALTDVSGQGLGSTGAGSKLSDANPNSIEYSNFDSGLMEVPFVLGWPGTLMYVIGLFIMVKRAITELRRARSDKFVVACASSGLVMVSMMVFINTLTGSFGLVGFFGLMMPIAARRYAEYHAEQIAAAPQPTAPEPNDPVRSGQAVDFSKSSRYRALTGRPLA